jgi:diguanylate cyclase (GGDEF)-like protein
MPKVKNIEHIIKSPDALLTISSAASINEAAKIMKEKHIGCLLVLDENDDFVGVISERDMISKFLAETSAEQCPTVGEIMTKDVISCSLDSNLAEVERLMDQYKIRHVPIIENNKPVGIISSRDAIAYRLVKNEEMKSAAEQLAMLSTGFKSLDFDDVIELTISSVPENFEAERALLCFTPTDSSSQTIYRKGCPLQAENLPEASRIKQLCEQKQIICDKICNECEILGGRAPRLVIPMTIREHSNKDKKTLSTTYAYLCMCRFKPDSVTSPEARIYKATLLQETLSANLTNAKLYQSYKKARQDSEIDPLTGVCSRRMLDAALNSEFARAIRYNRKFSIGIVDVDNFKEINDIGGHAAGDKALQKVAKLMRDQVRATDIIIVRYGGDEFVLIMPETGLTGARVLLERIRRLVRTVSIPKIQKISVSCGAAEWSGTIEDNPVQIMQRADEALYEAKNKGRNCVIAKQLFCL